MFTKKNQPLVVAGAVLVIACTILATLVSLQGSRLRHIEYFGTLYDYSAVLHYNSALKQSSTLKISTIPSVRTNAQIKGDTIVLSFDEPVLSNQKYHVNIEGIQAENGKISTSSFSFSTNIRSYMYLERTSEKNDSIFLKEIGGDKSLVYSAERIALFRAGKSTLFVLEYASESEIDTTAKLIINKQSKIVNPPKGEVIAVYGTTSSDLYMVATQDSQTFDKNLYSYDSLSDTFSELPRAGSQFNASRVLAADDGVTYVYQNGTNNVTYIDNIADSIEPINLGLFTKPLQFTTNTSGLFVQDTLTKFSLLKASDNSKQDTLVKGDVMDARVTHDLKEYIILRNRGLISSSNQQITLENEEVVKILFELPSEDGLVTFDSLTLSSNSQYLSFEIAKTPVIYTGFRYNQKPENSELHIMDIKGELLETVAGSNIQWL